MDLQLRALCDLSVATVRESAGRHEYDGVVQDLSPAGVAQGLAALGPTSTSSAPTVDDHDAALIRAHERAARITFGELELHRKNPLFHIMNADVSCYDRSYAPLEERTEAKRRHLAAWPAALDAAVNALDQVAAPVATALLPSAQGLAEALPAGESPARAAHHRFVRHLEGIADRSQHPAELGAPALEALLNAAEATDVTLPTLRTEAEREEKRLHQLLAEALERLAPDESLTDSRRRVAELGRDHPASEAVIAEAQSLTNEVISWTRQSGLVPFSDGECRVGIAPASQRCAAAMMAWSAPGEREAPSWFYITPPSTDWSTQEQEAWLMMFSRTMLPAIVVHEVAPGHFTHSRALRHAASEVRRTLHSSAFIEGWAHYAEELALEEGFRSHDPRFAIGVALEGLLRVARLQCSIAVHSGEMPLAEAARYFTEHAFLEGPAARAEAERALFDPTYGRYTWGKLALRALRERARKTWGGAFSLRRFHTQVLELGAPPLGLLESVLL